VTVEAMNETAEDIGAYDTVAGTPSGLDVAGQSSSPYDLALIFRRLVANHVTAAILTTPTAQIPAVAGRSAGYQIQTQNPLRGYPGTLGGKTGFTDAARHTFVTAAQRNGRRLVASVMNTENKPLRAADQAALLLDWGFALPPDIEGVGTLVDSGDLGTPASSAAPTTAPVDASVRGTAAAPAPSSVLPLSLAGGVLLVLLVGFLGRRRLVRRAPAPSRRGPAGPTGGSPSTPP
jgi:D-alanyl-D-alanine carboxypeptidase (penicillin-binding protein 5/6)